MDWANSGLPCLLVRPLTNLQIKEGLRVPYSLFKLNRITKDFKDSLLVTLWEKH